MSANKILHNIYDIVKVTNNEEKKELKWNGKCYGNGNHANRRAYLEIQIQTSKKRLSKYIFFSFRRSIRSFLQTFTQNEQKKHNSISYSFLSIAYEITQNDILFDCLKIDMV